MCISQGTEVIGISTIKATRYLTKGSRERDIDLKSAHTHPRTIDTFIHYARHIWQRYCSTQTQKIHETHNTNSLLHSYSLVENKELNKK